jgi:hypothetical protein
MVFIWKFFKTYTSGILFYSSHRVEQNGKNEILNENHMTEINHFKFFTICSGDVVMIGAADVDSSHAERIIG